MIQLSTHTGPDERPVTVRVDDLPETERALVRETLRLIKVMSDREAGLYLLVTLLNCCAVLGMMPIIWHYIPRPGFLTFMALVMAGVIPFGFMNYLITRTIANRRHDTDALHLSNLGRHARCRELINEYAEANTWFAKAIKRRFAQTVAAH